MDNSERNTPTMAVASVGSRGNLVIPAEIRKLADIRPGCRLLVFGKGNTLFLVKFSQLYDLTCSYFEMDKREE
jgi:AbrB family looped-hinge helix DNA binding protein